MTGPAVAALFELQASFLSKPGRVVRFDGREALNAPYVFRIDLALDATDVLAFDLDGATGKDATLVVNDRDGKPRMSTHGIVAALEHLEDPDADVTARLRVHLVPRLSRLAFGEHSRVFIAKTLPEILTETLTGGGSAPADFDLRLDGDHEPMPSSSASTARPGRAFVTRWLERVGAYYFFEQGSSQEKLVITDDPASQVAALQAPVRFVPLTIGEDTSSGEALRTLRVSTRAVPKHVTVTDYNFMNPSLAVVGDADVVAGPGGVVSLFDVNVDAPADAKAKASTVAQQHLSAHTIYRAEGRVVGLAPGFTLALQEHPRSALDQTYLVTSLRHEGWDAAGETAADRSRDAYRCELEAVVAGARWLPPAVTPWPRIAVGARWSTARRTPTTRSSTTPGATSPG